MFRISDSITEQHLLGLLLLDTSKDSGSQHRPDSQGFGVNKHLSLHEPVATTSVIDCIQVEIIISFGRHSFGLFGTNANSAVVMVT
jgi:hypothetical protein